MKWGSKEYGAGKRQTKKRRTELDEQDWAKMMADATTGDENGVWD